MRHQAHFCTYELLASWVSSLLDVSQCDDKRSNTLLTISALGVLKPISFQHPSCCLRYRFYDWTKSPAYKEDHWHHCHPWGMQIAITSDTCKWSRVRSNRNNILLIKQSADQATLSLKLWWLNYNSHVMYLIGPWTNFVIWVSLFFNVPPSSWSPFSELNVMQLILRLSLKVLNIHGSYL